MTTKNLESNEATRQGQTQGQALMVFSVLAPCIYVACNLYHWPLFTFFPATNHLTWGWTPMSDDEGPAMYWYGWLLSTLILGVGLAGLAGLSSALKNPTSNPLLSKLLPHVLHLLWILPLVLLPVIVYSLKFYWLHR
jgi:hypothetical protein